MSLQPTHAQTEPMRLNLVTASLVDVVSALQAGWVTSEQLLRHYLDAIETDDRLGQGFNAIFQPIGRGIALAMARQLDVERREGRTRGALHGVPIVVKDHLGTGPDLGLSTTGGLAVLVGTICREDSAIVQRLRRQGLLIIGKCSMTLMHNMFYDLPRSPGPWNQILPNAVGVYDPLKPGGSSSGSAVALAAGFAAASIGAESFGSIVNPASTNALYALKPSVGLIADGADGNLILSERTDSVGPMGKTVMDVAMMLDALVPEDKRAMAHAALLAEKGEHRVFRVAVIDPDRETRRAIEGEKGKVEAEEKAIASLAQSDQVELVDLLTTNADEYGRQLLAAVEVMVGDDSCLAHLDAIKTVLTVDMYDNINRFLGGLNGCEVKNVEDLLQWHRDHPESYADISGMTGNCAHLERVAAWRGDRGTSEYLKAMALMEEARSDIEAFMELHQLDAVIGGLGLSLLPALCGAPICTVAVGIYPGLREPQALFMVGRPHHDLDLLRLMLVAEQTFGPRPRPDIKRQMVN